MSRAVWFARWHITGGLVWLALKIAPKGAARDLLLSYLNAYGREVMQTISDAKSE